MPVRGPVTNPYRILSRPHDGVQGRGKYARDVSRLDGYVGVFKCRLTALTPIEVNYRRDVQFSKAPRIPAASLKGLVRSVAEFVGGGCCCFNSKQFAPKRFAPCTDEPCVTCSTFGMLNRGVVQKGRTFFTDGEPDAVASHPKVVIYQGQPKTTHGAFYKDPDDQKFYHHFPSALGGIKAASRNKHANDLYPVGPGSTFLFELGFEGLGAERLGVLAYALGLQPGLLHKLGRGKGQGLGSVKIEILSSEVESAKQRYRGEASSTEGLPADVEEVVARLKSDPKLDAFRRMLCFNAHRSVEPPLGYPRHDWFKANSQTGLRPVEQVLPELTDELLTDPAPPAGAQAAAKPKKAPKVVRKATELPANFPEEIWAKVEDETFRSELARIATLKQNFKGQAAPIVEAWSSETDPDRKAALVSAMKCNFGSNNKKWKKWAKAKGVKS